MKRALRVPSRERTRPAQVGGGALIATLIAAEAAARVEPGASPVDPLADAPEATSLEDILGIAQICETRSSFGGFGDHDHDWFRPRFLHARHAGPGRSHDDDEHAGIAGAGASHAGGHDAAAPSAHGTLPVKPATHDLSADVHHQSGQIASDEIPTVHIHELLIDGAHDQHATLDRGLDALLAAAHGAHEAAAETASEAPAADSASEPAVIAVLAGASDGHHLADAVVVTAEI